MHSVNSGVQDNAKISRIQGEECVALGCEGGDENRFVLGGGQEDRSPCAQGIRRPLDLSLQVLPMRSGLRLELVEIFRVSPRQYAAETKHHPRSAARIVMSRESDFSDPQAERITLLSRKTLTFCRSFPKPLRSALVLCNPFLERLQRDIAHRHGFGGLQKYPAIPHLHQHHGIFRRIQPKHSPNLWWQSDSPPLRYRNSCHAAILQCNH